MVKNFWKDLPKPIFVLAPLANVTDAAFRRVIAKYSKPQGPAVFYTEFVSADGLCLAGPEGKAKLMRDLVFTEAERPIVAQFFTATPEYMEKAAALAQELGFDGVDINMGCPDKTIEKQGAGAKLIQTPELAVKLIEAAKRGAPNLPVSVKTRVGYNTDVLEEWIPVLLKAEPAALVLHARTRKDMSKVPARWERVKRAIEIRDAIGLQHIPLLGNGDVQDVAHGRAQVAATGADGAMLGRAIFGRPWLFSEGKTSSSGEMNTTPTPAEEVFPSLSERLRILVEHTKAFEELLGDIKSFAIMKKHFKAYVEGFDGAKELRMQLMETENATQVEEIIETYLRGI